MKRITVRNIAVIYVTKQWPHKQSQQRDKQRDGGASDKKQRIEWRGSGEIKLQFIDIPQQQKLLNMGLIFKRPIYSVC